ncbi:MAG: Mur ligase domain-containing protein, partial [Acidimicrobiales bacterium]
MRLDQLLSGVEALGGRGDPSRTEVVAITHDSRSAGPGSLFCCLRGRHVDGHDVAGDAVARGAVALLCERTLDVGVEITQAVVADSRRAMAPVAANFYGQPSRHLDVVGVTGTNGKTTTTLLLASILEADGRPTGVVGTLS